MRYLRTSKAQHLRVLAIVAVVAFAAGSAIVAYATNPVTFYACRNVRLNVLYNRRLLEADNVRMRAQVERELTTTCPNAYSR